MRARAELVFLYSSEEEAELVARLLELDNRMAPKGIKVRTEPLGREVITRAEHPSVGTLFATIDDLLFCEKLIDEMMRL
ncbi:MAG: hypothetical protein GXO66_09380 [Euryarchaeota archaeon]|nr:hypothetical protein [Euryarchaeota archaeon]